MRIGSIADLLEFRKVFLKFLFYRHIGGANGAPGASAVADSAASAAADMAREVCRASAVDRR